jgi:two-component system NtrC family sensor kinase
VGTKAKDGSVYASFTDTGPGIPPEKLQRIFEPFFSTQDKMSQVGLGLSVSYGIVKAHQGSIQVKSNPGEGTLFVVILPATNGDGTAQNPSIQEKR